MLIIDEVHSLLDGTYRQQRLMLNTLRFLANDLRMPLDCAGTADAKRALMTDQQLVDRFEAAELTPWRNDEPFMRFLATFQAMLPLRKQTDLLVAPTVTAGFVAKTAAWQGRWYAEECRSRRRTRSSGVTTLVT